MWAVSLIERREGGLPAKPTVMRPSSAEDVSKIMKWATSERKPVVVRGGGSGVCGGAQAYDEEIVMDMTGMDRIISIDPESGIVVAEAGVGGRRLEEALNGQGLTLGHFPQSIDISTVGGWVATKAIGQLSTRYGGIEERLLGLKCVFSDGTIAESRPVPRASSGPDWWRLLIGSEGTLGVVVEATLSVFHQPATTRFAVWKVPTLKAGWIGIRGLVRSGARPSVVRLYDQTDTAINFSAIGFGDECLLMTRFEGDPRLVEAELEVARDRMGEAGATQIGDEAAVHWWEDRFEAVGRYTKIMSGESGLGRYAVADTFETSATWPQLADLYSKVGAALRESCDVVGAHTSHLYQSGANIYFTFLITSAQDDGEAYERYTKAWDDAMTAAVSSGGSISHHHGIGLLKAGHLRAELGSGYEAVERIRGALDPTDVLNPRKLRAASLGRGRP